MSPVFNGCGDTAVWMLRLNKPYKRSEGKTNDLLIAFIGYVNDLNQLQQFKVSFPKIPPSTSVHISTLFATVRVALLRSSWRSCFMTAALFIPILLLCLLFLCRLRFSSIPTDKNRICTRQFQTAVSSHPLKIGHMFIWTYLLGIVHTVTSLNIYYSSWNTLYTMNTDSELSIDSPEAATSLYFRRKLKLMFERRFWWWELGWVIAIFI